MRTMRLILISLTKPYRLKRSLKSSPLASPPYIRNNTGSQDISRGEVDRSHYDTSGQNKSVQDKPHRSLTDQNNRYRPRDHQFWKWRANPGRIIVEVVLVSLIVILGIVLLSFPIIVVGGLSRFRKGSSTRAQRVWTMARLAFGIFTSFSISEYEDHSDPDSVIWMGVLGLSYCAPAIGGFVVVAQMIKEYGVCIRIS